MIDPDMMLSDRLGTFLAGGAPGLSYGPITIEAASLGTPDEWSHTAVSYLKCMLNGTQGGTLGGSVDVSAAAIGIVLTYVERLEIEAGIIPMRGSEAHDG